MSIIPTNVKRSFKVVLNSNDTTSWSGPHQYNATYAVNIAQIVADPLLLDKVYNVTFNFKSRTSTTANANLSTANTYSLNLRLNNSGVTTTASTINGASIVGMLDLVPDFASNLASGTALPLMLSASDGDNGPFQVTSLRNLSSIYLRVIRNVTDDIYQAGSSDALTRYVCVLTFTEA